MTLIYPPHRDLLLRPPLLGDFTWVNQGDATATQGRYGLVMIAPPSSGDNLRLLMQPVPTIPYTLTVKMIPHFIGMNFSGGGIAWRESSTGRIVSHQATARITTSSNDPVWDVIKWTNPSTYNSSYQNRGIMAGHELWLQVSETSTQRICRISGDGETFITLHTVSRTDFLTADQIGIFVNAVQNSFPAAATFTHWVIT